MADNDFITVPVDNHNRNYPWPGKWPPFEQLTLVTSRAVPGVMLAWINDKGLAELTAAVDADGKDVDEVYRLDHFERLTCSNLPEDIGLNVARGATYRRI